MTIAYADFIAAFPEFTDAGTYPVAQVDFWIAEAATSLNACLFGDAINLASMLYVAHNVVLSARAAAKASTGGIAGEVEGPKSSKSIGALSVGYAGSTSMPNAGEYNYTSYGQRYYRMARAYAAGSRYVPRSPIRIPPYPITPGY